jgi:predicted acetyltransferase
MDPVIRPGTEQDLPAIERALGLAFGGDPSADNLAGMRATTELDRARCAFDGEELVGTIGAYSFELAVPGATARTAGTTMVTVRLTHRRRGLMRALMRAHLDEVRDRGEPLAALWASESSIYDRFGFGPATASHSYEIDTAHAAFREPVRAPGRVRLADLDEAKQIVPAIYEACWRERPGHFGRSPVWWEWQHFHEPEAHRGGESESRWLVYEDAEGPRGYARYRVKQNWPRDGVADNRSSLLALYGSDPAARALLWRHVLDQDLVARLTAWGRPTDCELPWLLADPRRARRGMRDELWVRVMDVKAALETRRYRSEGALVLELHDPVGSPSTWRLEASPDGAKCEPSTRTPALRMGLSELGTIYLGGAGAGALARAGRIEGSASDVARADALFNWDPAPWCPEIF